MNLDKVIFELNANLNHPDDANMCYSLVEVETILFSINYLEAMRAELRKCHDELKSWQADQGEYGTWGYDEWLPEIKKLIE